MKYKLALMEHHSKFRDERRRERKNSELFNTKFDEEKFIKQEKIIVTVLNAVEKDLAKFD